MLLKNLNLGYLLIVVDFVLSFVFTIGSSMAIVESKNINQMGISGVVGQ